MPTHDIPSKVDPRTTDLSISSNHEKNEKKELKVKDEKEDDAHGSE